MDKSDEFQMLAHKYHFKDEKLISDHVKRFIEKNKITRDEILKTEQENFNPVIQT